MERSAATGHPQIAFDLEMVQVNSNETISMSDITDPAKFELLCIGVAYREAPESEIRSRVLLRDGRSPESEAKLIDEFLEWVDSQSDAETVFTYNGSSYDYPQLAGRIERCEAAIGTQYELHERFEQFKDTVPHEDLMLDVEKTFGYRISLEQMAERMGIRVPVTYWKNYSIPDSVRKQFREEKELPWITGADMTVVGEAFLKYREKGHTDSSPHAEMLDLIWKYAESDVPVLFKLADKRPFPAGRRGLKKKSGN